MVGAAPASGQAWLALPNGDVGYNTDFTTSGSFRCTPWLLFGTCNASGNSVVLGNAGNTMTISFEGLSRPITVTNQQQSPIQLGTFKTVTTGSSPFQFPATRAPNGGYLYFLFKMQSQSPLPQTHYLGGGFLLRASGLRRFQQTDGITFTTIPRASGPYYPLIAYSSVIFPNLVAGDQEVDLTASPSLTPEPSTNILLASGLLGLAFFVRRRRSRA
jgi:hypothetical protein